MECCHQQIVLMIEPSIYGKNLGTIEFVANAVKYFFAAFPADLSQFSETGNSLCVAVLNIQKQLLRVLSKCVNYASTFSYMLQ